MYYIRIVFVPISQLFPVSLLLPTNWTSCSFSLFQEKKKTKLKPKTTQILQTPKAKEILKQSKEAKLTKKIMELILYCPGSGTCPGNCWKKKNTFSPMEWP